MNINPVSHKIVRWGWVVLVGVALAVSLIFASQAPPAEASLYWASANGVAPLNSGVRSSTPSLCFVGDAVTVRPQRVAQIVQFLREYEMVADLRFISPVSGNAASAEVVLGGNINNLKCPASIPAGGLDVFAGDIRVVLPGTNIDATDPVPGTGCWTDKLKSAPSCVARDSTHIDCFARGVDDSIWGKHWSSSNGWSDWDQALGGVINAAPAVASLSATNLEVVVKGTDSALYIRTWNGSSWTTSWAVIPGTSGLATSAPACVGHDAHHLTCAVRWWNNYIYAADRDNGVWGTWASTGLMTPVGNGPGITSWGSGRLDVFARGLVQLNGEASLTHVWSTNYGAGWSGVEDLLGNITGAPACQGYSTGGVDGKIDCFARGGDGNVWKKSYPGGSVWNGWVTLAIPVTGDLGVDRRATTTLDVFAAGANGALWQTTSTNGGSTWSSWSDLGSNNGWGSWSDAPWNLNNTYHRACQYNLKLGDDPWCPNWGSTGEVWPCASNASVTPYMNHTLHEVGHALGLAHEQARNDANVAGCGAGYGGGITAGHITPYDRYSVMHYQYLPCGINGNYDNTGLSYYDKVAVHILYPPAGYPAEITGNLGIKSGETLSLTSLWKAQGATMSFVASNFVWRVDNVVRSTTPDLSYAGLAVGDHTVTLDYDDFLGRHHFSSWKVMVFNQTQVNNIAAIQGGALTPLYNIMDFGVMLPITNR